MYNHNSLTRRICGQKNKKIYSYIQSNVRSYCFPSTLNSLPNNNILDISKKWKHLQKFVLGKVENIVGKGENAG